MDLSALEKLADEFRTQAETLRAFGAEGPAAAVERCAALLDERLRAWWHEELSIAEAAQESGYSRERLRELVREGTLPDHRPPGSRGEILIRRCDLPRRVGSSQPREVPARTTLDAALERVGPRT